MRAPHTSEGDAFAFSVRASISWGDAFAVSVNAQTL
jgi:hypothetical protein